MITRPDFRSLEDPRSFAVQVVICSFGTSLGRLVGYCFLPVEVHGIGMNPDYQSGCCTPPNLHAAAALAGISANSITSGYAQTCVMYNSYNVRCWGWNTLLANISPADVDLGTGVCWCARRACGQAMQSGCVDRAALVRADARAFVATD